MEAPCEPGGLLFTLAVGEGVALLGCAGSGAAWKPFALGNLGAPAGCWDDGPSRCCGTPQAAVGARAQQASLTLAGVASADTEPRLLERAHVTNWDLIIPALLRAQPVGSARTATQRSCAPQTRRAVCSAAGGLPETGQLAAARQVAHQEPRGRRLGLCWLPALLARLHHGLRSASGACLLRELPATPCTSCALCSGAVCAPLLGLARKRCSLWRSQGCCRLRAGQRARRSRPGWP